LQKAMDLGLTTSSRFSIRSYCESCHPRELSNPSLVGLDDGFEEDGLLAFAFGFPSVGLAHGEGEVKRLRWKSAQ